MIRNFLNKIFQRQQFWYERYFVWLVVGGVGIAMALSLMIGLTQSVWFDEAYSIWVAKQPVGELIRLASVDTHPPFYYLLLKAWAGMFGWGEVALRSLSVLAMGGAMTVAVVFVKRFFGVRTALIALAFMTVAPFLLRYGFEIRMYALASFIGIAATYVLVRAVDEKNQPKQWWLYGLYAILVALGVYTLYYTALLWIVHVVWLVWLTISRKQSILKQRWWVAYAGSVVLFLPWLSTFLIQLNNGALAPIAQQMTTENMVSVLSFTLFYQPSWQLGGVLSLVILAVICALVYVWTKGHKTISKQQKPYVVLVALYAFLPIILIALISLNRPMYVERYLAHVQIGLVLFLALVASLIVRKRPGGEWMIPAAIVALFVSGAMHLAQVGNFNFQRLQTPQVKQATQVIHCNDNAVILAADPYVAIELAYYVHDCPIHFYSEYATMGGGYAPLSGNPLQVSDPTRELADDATIRYVYYDKPKLQMPTDATQTSVYSFGPLHVAEYVK